MSQKKSKPLPTVTVEVTADDVRVAKVGDSSHCMIARALARSIGVSERFVSVDLQLIEYSDPQRHLRISYLTPKIAQERLLDFDAGEKVEPFTLTLRRPVQARPSDLGLPRDARRTSDVGPRSQAKMKERNERLRALQAKRERGAPMSREEKGALKRMETTEALGGLVKGHSQSVTKKVVVTTGIRTRNGQGSTVRVEGGDRPVVPTKNRTLSNRRGRRRAYGLRDTKR